MTAAVGRGAGGWRRAATAALLLAVCALAMVTGVGVAAAHAQLVRSDPPNGGRVDAMPDHVSLEFSEAVVTLDTKVTSSAQERFDTGPAQIRAGDGRFASVPVRTGANGIYTLSWQALADDGHTTQGSFFFVVGDQVPDRDGLLALYRSAASGGGPGANPFEVIARFGLILALALLSGTSLALLVSGGAATDSAPVWRISRRVLAGGALLLAASATLLAARQLLSGYGLSGSDIRAYLGSDQGSAWMARASIAIAAGAVVLFVRPRRLALGAVVALATAAQLSVSLVSHSHTLVGSSLAVLVDFTHVLFGGVWAGGLLLLALILPLAIRSGAGDDGRRALAVAGRRFGLIALSGAGGVVTAGLLLAAWHLGNWGQFTSSLYGESLLAKLALLAGALALGASNRLVLVRGLEAETPDAVRRFRRVAGVEAAALVAIFAFAALMTSSETGTAKEDTSQRGPIHLSASVRGVEVRLVATPGRPGLNVFDSQFRKGGKPVDRVDEPTLLLSLPDAGVQLDEIPMTQSGPGQYSAVAALTQPGAWFARAAGDVDAQFIAARFSLPDSSVPVPAYESDATFARLLRILAAAVAAVTVAGVALEAVLRLRGRSTRLPPLGR